MMDTEGGGKEEKGERTTMTVTVTTTKTKTNAMSDVAWLWIGVFPLFLWERVCAWTVDCTHHQVGS